MPISVQIILKDNDFNIRPASWEQIAQDRTKWRCLIRKGADDYEAKRVCEAEGTRKARANGSPSDLRVIILRIDLLCLQHTVWSSDL